MAFHLINLYKMCELHGVVDIFSKFGKSIKIDFCRLLCGDRSNWLTQYLCSHDVANLGLDFTRFP